jgi:hypothetical protein
LQRVGVLELIHHHHREAAAALLPEQGIVFQEVAGLHLEVVEVQPPAPRLAEPVGLIHLSRKKEEGGCVGGGFQLPERQPRRIEERLHLLAEPGVLLPPAPLHAFLHGTQEPGGFPAPCRKRRGFAQLNKVPHPPEECRLLPPLEQPLPDGRAKPFDNSGYSPGKEGERLPGRSVPLRRQQAKLRVIRAARAPFLAQLQEMFPKAPAAPRPGEGVLLQEEPDLRGPVLQLPLDHLVQGRLELRPRSRLVEQDKGRVHPRLGRVLPEKPGTERMEGGDRGDGKRPEEHPPGGRAVPARLPVRQRLSHPLPHLHRRLVGEGDGDDLLHRERAWKPGLPGQQTQVELHQRSGLA